MPKYKEFAPPLQKKGTPTRTDKRIKMNSSKTIPNWTRGQWIRAMRSIRNPKEKGLTLKELTKEEKTHFGDYLNPN